MSEPRDQFFEHLRITLRLRIVQYIWFRIF